MHSMQLKLLRKIKEDMNNTKMFDEWLDNQKRKYPNRWSSRVIAVLKLGKIDKAHFPIWDRRFAEQDTRLQKTREESPDTDVNPICVNFFYTIKLEMSDDEAFNFPLYYDFKELARALQSHPTPIFPSLILTLRSSLSSDWLSLPQNFSL